MIEWIPHDDKCRVPPEAVRHVVRAMKFPTSKSVAETSNYVSVDYVPVGSNMFSVTLCHFKRMGNSWAPCEWEDLSDEHRLAIRTDKYRNRYWIGEYKDHRYYIFEALT